MSWYEFDEEALMTCRKCGWQGTSKQADLEIGSLSFHYDCPKCSKALAVFDHTSHLETKQMAAKGNEKAKRALPRVLSREEFLARASESELKTPDQLPDLEGEEIVIEWDFEDSKPGEDDNWTVLRHEGKEIWREIAYYEGLDRYREVATILIEKYADRLVGFPATSDSFLYLYGDNIREDPVKQVNAILSRNIKKESS